MFRKARASSPVRSRSWCGWPTSKSKAAYKSVRPTLACSSVGGDVLGGKWVHPAARRPVGRQSGIADLVEESSVADAEGAGRLLAIPVVGLQNLQDDLALQFAGGLAGDHFQRDRPIEVQVEGGKFLLVRHQIAADDFFIAQDDVALDQVLEFANVARPVVLLQG